MTFKFRFRVEPASLADIHPAPQTWVWLAVMDIVGSVDLVTEHLERALAFHRKITDQAAAHLNLLYQNTYRTPWLAAKLLLKDPARARAAAVSLAKHLATTKPGNMTSFEEHVFCDRDLRTCIEQFSNEEPAVLLWHANGKYEKLFKFLAPRFLLAPDHVLDAERIHARWQWGSHTARATQLPFLNAMLRLRHYRENNADFPTDEDLHVNLQAERRQHRVEMDAVDDETALGLRLSATPC